MAKYWGFKKKSLALSLGKNMARSGIFFWGNL